MIHSRLIAKGLKYYLTFPHFKGLGIQPTTLFDLVHEVFSKDIDKEALHKIENYKQSVFSEKGNLKRMDYGAQVAEGKEQKVSRMAKRESVSHHYGKLLFRLVSELGAQNILELGTSMGISACYMAVANHSGKVFTLEGSHAKAEMVKRKYQQHKIDNVDVIHGLFNVTLPEVLKHMGRVDFVFMDGNHKKEPTLMYFNEIVKCSHDRTVFVLDDINWSPGMMEAWAELQAHSKSTVCLDLYRFGIIFVNPNLPKRSYSVFY